MDLLTNPKINEHLFSKCYFDMVKNNSKLDIIIPLENNPVQCLKNIFFKLINNDKATDGYYYLRDLFSAAQMVDPDIVINLVIETITNKINIIKDTIFNDNNTDISLPMYTQIWKSYTEFTKKLYHIIKNYQEYLVEKNIKTENMSHDILNILNICMFYGNIVQHADKNILTTISNNIVVDKKNIEQLVDYIESMKRFMSMKNFTKIDLDKLTIIIKTILNQTEIINMLCSYIHQLILSSDDIDTKINGCDYQTMVANDSEKKSLNKIFKIITILGKYSDRTKLLLCYTKFMQARIINLKYDKLELEIELVKMLSGTFGKKNSQSLLDCIADMINSKNFNNSLHTADVKNLPEKINGNDFSIGNFNPIILSKNVWKIYNTSGMEIIYPKELLFYFDIINKSYADFHDNKYMIHWQPTLGSASFTAYLCSKKIDITCNILQSVALSYFNENPNVSVSQFSIDTSMNEDLSQKIFESLFESNLITYQNMGHDDNPIYTVNTENYTGDLKIDIRRTFIEVFETEENNSNNVKKSCNVAENKSVTKNTEENDDSDSGDDGSPISHPKVRKVLMGKGGKSPYQMFISTQLIKLRKEHPGLKNMEYMKMAAQAWNRAKDDENIKNATEEWNTATKKKYNEARIDIDSMDEED